MENRKMLRSHLLYFLKIHDRSSGELIGHLIDLTLNGIQLISEQKLDVDRYLMLRMALPTELKESKEIIFDAKCVWSKRDVNPNYFAAGLKVTNLYWDDVQSIRELIATFGVESDAPRNTQQSSAHSNEKI